MTPNGIIARPFLVIMPGMIVCIGRLPGAIAFGCFGSSRKLVPRFCRITPVFGPTTPLPKE